MQWAHRDRAVQGTANDHPVSSGLRDIAFRLLATALLVVLTFPRLDVVSDVGVDNSLAWAFNHLFSTGLDQASHLVFPHGPLAFIMYPQALGGDLGAVGGVGGPCAGELLEGCLLYTSPSPRDS